MCTNKKWRAKHKFSVLQSFSGMLGTQFGIVFALNYIWCFLSLIDWLIDWTNWYNIWTYIVRCPNESNWFCRPAIDIFYSMCTLSVCYVSYGMNINLQKCWKFGNNLELLDFICTITKACLSKICAYCHSYVTLTVSICFQNLNYTLFLSRMAYKFHIQSQPFCSVVRSLCPSIVNII